MGYIKKYQRFYLRPIGNAIYDDFGILYPKRENVNLFCLIRDAGGVKVRWTKKIYWSSQNECLTFLAKFTTIANLSIKLSNYPIEIVNVWDEFREMVKNGKIDRIIIKERTLFTGNKEIADNLSVMADIVDGVDNYVYSG